MYVGVIRDMTQPWGSRCRVIAERMIAKSRRNETAVVSEVSSENDQGLRDRDRRRRVELEVFLRPARTPGNISADGAGSVAVLSAIGRFHEAEVRV